MVDINLFDEGHEDNSFRDERVPGASSDNKHDTDDFSGDFGLGDDLAEDAELGANSLLESDETLPDFDQTGDDSLDDYSFGGQGNKKSPPWLLIIVGGVAVMAVLFMYVILPYLNKPRPVKQPQPRPPVTKPVSEGTTQQPQPPTEQAAATLPEGTLDVLSAAKTVFDNLSAQGQAGVVIINGNQYLVEYASMTPGVSEAMGQRIQTLFGADSFEVSPEEKHATSGEEHFWGVVSGTLPPLKTHTLAAGAANPFTSMAMFQDRIKALISQNGLTLESIEKPVGITVDGKRQSSGHMIISGEKQNVMSLIGALDQVSGNWRVEKLLLAPTTISDFSAARVKMGITFWVEIG